MLQIAAVLHVSWAQVYVDPGSGAILWQIIVAAFVGGLFFFRKLLRNPRSWFRK